MHVLQECETCVESPAVQGTFCISAQSEISDEKFVKRVICIDTLASVKGK